MLSVGVLDHGVLHEADTRAKLIDPKLKLAWWGEGQIECEHYFAKYKRRRFVQSRTTTSSVCTRLLLQSHHKEYISTTVLSGDALGWRQNPL